MILFNYALQNLAKSGYPIDGSQIFLWDPIKRMFMYVGSFPNQNDMSVQF